MNHEAIIVTEKAMCLSMSETHHYTAVVLAENVPSLNPSLEGYLFVNSPTNFSTVKDGKLEIKLEEFYDPIIASDLIALIKPELDNLIKDGLRYPFIVRTEVKELEEAEAYYGC